MDSLVRRLGLLAPRIMACTNFTSPAVRSFSMLTMRTTTNPHQPAFAGDHQQHILASVPHSAPLFFVPNCGFKMVGRLRKRCKDCYFMTRDQRMFVICKTHPRHKQMGFKPEPKSTWILTHASQSPKRPW